MEKNREVERNQDRNKTEISSKRSFGLMPQFDRMFEGFFGDRLPSLGSSTVQETDDAYCLSAEIPGIPKDDIEINVNGNILTVRAEQNEEKGTEGKNYQRQYRKYQQSFALPTSVDADKIEAHCENGLLEIWIPKAAESKAKKIEVQSGKGGFMNRLLGKNEDKVSQKNQNAKH